MFNQLPIFKQSNFQSRLFAFLLYTTHFEYKKRRHKGKKNYLIALISRTLFNKRNFINCRREGLKQIAITGVCLQPPCECSFGDMEYRISAPPGFTPAVVGSRRTSHDVFISPRKGTFTRNGIYTIEEPIKKAPKRPNAKEYEIIYKAYLELREENGVLRRERQKIQGELEAAKGKVLAVSQENEELNEHLFLQHTENWGQIIRAKDEELKRLNEFIHKMSYDRAEAINNKSVAEMAVDELKSKLRYKTKQVKEVKELEKIQSKAVLLNETEKLRSERNNAIANLKQLEALVEKLKQEASHERRISEERKMVIQEIHKRLTTREKQIEELRKQLAMSRLFNK